MSPRLFLCLAAALPSFAACSFTLSPTSATMSYLSGDALITVTASASNCSRTAVSNSSWITISVGSSGTGNGVVGFTVTQNPSNSPRSGSLTVAGILFGVTQNGAPCTYSLSPGSAAVPAAGGSGSFNVTTGCSWTAASNASWITASGSGNGNGTIQYTADANLGTTSRSGTISVGTQNFTITQVAPCTFTTNPTGIQADPAGTAGSFTVTASANTCGWTALNNNPDFVSITSGGSGTGNGTVGYTIAPNTGGAMRSGLITVGNASFSILQGIGAGCTYMLSSMSASFPASGGTGSFTVTSSCSFTPTTTADWISIIQAGTSAVSYIVAGNTSSPPRTGSIAIGPLFFVIQQSGVPCGVTVSPTTVALGAGGGMGSITVTAADGCNWSAASNASWVTVQPSNGTGEGVVGYNAVPNTTAQTRTANVSIANQTVLLTQDATSCTGASLTPDHASVPAAGGVFNFHITTTCDYAATSNSAWITITNGNGSGGGDIAYTVAQNTSTVQRVGSIGVAGLRFTVTQDGATSGVTITPTSASFGAKGGTGVISVTCPAACSWTPSADRDWIRFTYASANGTGKINYTVATSDTTDMRTGSIVVAGQTFQITQAGMPVLQVSSDGVVNAASFAGGAVSPGELISIFGSGIGPSTAAGAQLTADRTSITNLIGETRVLFDGVPAPMLYTSASQVTAIVPYAVAGKSSTQVQLEYQGFASAAVGLNVTPATPAIFTLDGSGSGQGAIVNQDGGVNGAAAPAPKGSIIVIYATGSGQTNPAGVDGRLALAAPLPRPVAPISVLIGGVDAPVTYAGAAPLFPAGVLQINARVPPSVASGIREIRLRAGTAVSPPGVTVAIQ